MNKIKHYIIIRFYNENFGVIPIEQMTDFNFLNNVGVSLLKNNCLKSLENQTNKDFELIIIINDLIDANHKIISVLNDIKCSFPIHVMKQKEVNSLLNNILGYDYIITTRIDYDDFAKNTSVEEIQNIAKTGTSLPFIVHGYQNGIGIINDDITTTYEYLPKYPGPMSIMISLIINTKLTSKIYSIYKLGDHSRLQNGIKKLYEDENLEYSEKAYCIDYEPLSYLYVKTGYNVSYMQNNRMKWGDINYPVNESKEWFKNKFGADLK